MARTRERTAAERKIAQLETDVKGRAYKPGPDPPSYPTRAWVPITVELQHVCTGDSTGTNIAVSAVIAEIKARYAVTGQVACRIHKAAVWAISAGPSFPKPGLEADFYEIDNQTSSAIARRRTRDIGTIQMPARAGFIYPMVDQREIATATEENKLIVAATGNLKDTILVFQIKATFYSF